MPVKVVEEWLNSCSGCEISILNLGDTLLDLLPELNFVHIPVLMDHKYYGQTGQSQVMEIPEADISFSTGRLLETIGLSEAIYSNIFNGLIHSAIFVLLTEPFTQR